MMEWIAEIGSNHKGERSLAYRLVKAAAAAGATVVKFQAGRDPRDPIRYIDDVIPEAFQWCNSYGVEFIASCWSWAGLKLLQDLGVKRRKIAHQQADVDNVIAQATLDENLPTFVSIDLMTGQSRRFVQKHEQNTNITWLLVNSQYPNFYYKVDTKYPKGTGYSDHTHGIGAPLAAIVQGARVVECHFTLDPTEESIKDNHFACTPDEFAMLVKAGNEIALLGDMQGDNFRSTNWG